MRYAKGADLNKKQGFFVSVTLFLGTLLFAWTLTLSGEYTFTESLGMISLGYGLIAIIVVMAFGCIFIYERLA